MKDLLFIKPFFIISFSCMRSRGGRQSVRVLQTIEFYPLRRDVFVRLVKLGCQLKRTMIYFRNRYTLLHKTDSDTRQGLTNINKDI